MTKEAAGTVAVPAAAAAPAGEPPRGRQSVGEHDLHRHVEISDSHGIVALADVTISREPGHIARASLHAVAGHLAPGIRGRLVDAVLDLPELHQGARLEAAFPLGDSETLYRLRERCTDVTAHAAGATVLLEASIGTGQPSRTGAQAR
jgi:hypothetical protein